MLNEPQRRFLKAAGSAIWRPPTPRRAACRAGVLRGRRQCALHHHRPEAQGAIRGALKRLRNIADNPAVPPSSPTITTRIGRRLGWVMIRGHAEILDGGAEARQGPGAAARSAIAIPARCRSPICRSSPSASNGCELGRPCRRCVNAVAARRAVRRRPAEQSRQRGSLCLRQDLPPLVRQIAPGAVDVQVQHRHRRLVGAGFAPGARFGRVFERTSDPLGIVFVEHARLEVERVALARDLSRPVFRRRSTVASCRDATDQLALPAIIAGSYEENAAAPVSGSARATIGIKTRSPADRSQIARNMPPSNRARGEHRRRPSTPLFPVRACRSRAGRAGRSPG